MSVREPDHAGSWYSGSGPQLAAQLDQWLAAVPDNLGKGRVVISPHAGYAYSGPCAAWAYKCLHLTKAKRIFILHPSHHHQLSTAALPTVSTYQTPLSEDPLPLDLPTLRQLSKDSTVKITTMSKEVDEAEHSGEMQLPYIHRLLQKLYPNQPTKSYPPLVPIMVGATDPPTERKLGKLLAPYIANEENAFVISSDFCHWGSRFGYTFYVPDVPTPVLDPLVLPNGAKGDAAKDIHKSLSQGAHLRSSSQLARPKIYESIAHVDRACMCAIAEDFNSFQAVLQTTGNTICGRHPIGVFMAGLEASNDGNVANDRAFKFMRYERSSDAVSTRDSSVSYVSAYAQI